MRHPLCVDRVRVRRRVRCVWAFGASVPVRAFLPVRSARVGSSGDGDGGGEDFLERGRRKARGEGVGARKRLCIW